MAILRTLIRAPLLVFVTLWSISFVYLSRILVRPFSGRRHVAIRNGSFRMWGHLFCRVCGCRVTVEGTPPSGRFFLVSNHVSYVDIPVLGTVIGAAFIGKADLADWPVLGKVFAAADTIFIDRGRKRDVLRVIEIVDRKLDEGYGILLFPEGTSGKGDSMLRFKPSVLQFPAERGDAVHYATLEYRTPEGCMPPSRAICWWGDEAFFPHVRRLTSLPRFEAIIRFGPEPVQESDRKKLADRLRQAMEAQYIPMP